MKNLYIILIILLVFSACNDDFMNKYPGDEISDASYWNSAEDIAMYSNTFYPNIQQKGNLYHLDNGTDNQGPFSRDSYAWGETEVPTTGGGWAKSDWLQIRRCNYALVRIDNMGADPSFVRYEAEIRFFRAFFYFDKVKRFGDVPWIDKDLQTNSEELYNPRDSRKIVISKILEDLDFAIENLPEELTEQRLTKYAALAFKTEMCLFEGTFRKYHNLGDWQQILQEAVKAAEEVINSGLFNIYSTGNPDMDYFDLFVQYDLRNHPEAILVRHYELNLLMHNTPRSLSVQRTGWTQDFIESFLCTDGLPIGLSPLYQGDDYIEDLYIDRDPRLDQLSHNYRKRPYKIWDDGSEEWRILFPEFNSNYGYTGYWITKFYSPYERDRQQHMTIIDQFLFRYGELLVSYAEAKAELGQCTQQVLDISINKLRDRAGMPHLTVDVGFVDPNWPDWEVKPSPLGLINEIRRERRIELAAEGKRWWDLMRWKAGKLLENPKILLGARDPENNQYFELYPAISKRNWYDRLYLQPLPLQDLTLNQNLNQNPGWDF